MAIRDHHRLSLHLRPADLSLSYLIAGMQTAWLVKKDDVYLRMTKFFGKIFLINFAVGVVTGIVQEFQFGMNWSDYSKFVGNVFGAPLAMEALLTFFLESTFIGLWVFGWNKLPPRLHLATIWLTAIGTSLSAFFILAANSWMQHPVGYRVDPATHRVVLTSIWAVLTNSTLLAAWPHVLFAAFMVAGAVLVAASAWHLARGSGSKVFRRAMKLGLVVTLVAGIGTAVTGDVQARLMDSQQPMKMASAEALYSTSDAASFSLITIGSLNGGKELWSIRVPYLLSLIATLNPHGTVQGINNVERAYEKKYGPGSYKPVIPVTYWSFRLMAGFGSLAALLAAIGAVAEPARPHSAQPLVLPGRAVGPAAALPRDHDGLDLHRDGPPAVDRVRPADHGQERLARRDRVLGDHLDDRVHAPVRRPGGHRLVADGQARQGGRADRGRTARRPRTAARLPVLTGEMPS
jgi:cytochrome d ubiquinol oxidase subunit I